MQLFAIAGRAGAGKSTVAKMIIDHLGCGIVLPLAKAVKDAAFELGWDGKKDDKGRRLLQLLGTEIGRECIDPDIWIKKWELTCLELKPEVCIIDDVRFENEIEFFIERGAYTIKIVGREDSLVDTSHASEKGLKDEYFNSIFLNNGTTKALNKKVLRCLKLLEAIEEKD